MTHQRPSYRTLIVLISTNVAPFKSSNIEQLFIIRTRFLPENSIFLEQSISKAKKQTFLINKDEFLLFATRKHDQGRFQLPYQTQKTF